MDANAFGLLAVVAVASWIACSLGSSVHDMWAERDDG